MSALLQKTRCIEARYPLDPRDKTPRRQKLLLALSVLLLLGASAGLGLLSLYDSTLYIVWARFESYFDWPGLVALNVVPVVLLALILFALTDRAWLAFFLDAVLVMVLTFANYYKVVLRDDPLVFEDIAYAGEAAGIVGQYQITFIRPFFVSVCLCLAGTVLLLLVARGHIGGGWKRRLVRLGVAVIICCLCVGGYRLYYTSDERYDSFENYTLFNRWRPAEAYASRGFVYPFLHSITTAFPVAPEDYSKSEAEALLEAETENEIPADQKVNFICIMLESYTDLTEAGDLSFTEDPYASLHELEEMCLSGTMISDTMGGGTCNSERSFLTGMLYPQPNFRHSTWSYVQYFQEQGYVTEGLHPGYDWFYNRQVVNKNLGFQEYYFNENYFDERCEAEHASDTEFFQAIAERYAARDTQTPYFSFSVSYQGHGPYSSQELTWGKEYLAHDGLSDECYYTVNNYLSDVADTSEQLLALIQSLQDDTEPVVVLVFGDHKPTLGSGNSCYAELGINMDRDSETGFENYYATKYLIYANDAAKQVLGNDFQGTAPTVGPYFLMNVLFDACGYDGPAFLKISNALMEQSPVVHSTRMYLNDESLTDTFSGDEKTLKNFQMVQYYLRRKAYEK